MLLRVNRKRSLKVRECRITEEIGRNKVSPKKEEQASTWKL